MRSSAHRERFQGDLVAEALELTYKALRVGLGVVPKQQVVGAEFGVRAVALEHVVGDDEDRVRDSAHGLLVPATTFDSRVLTGEVGLLAAGHRRCGFDERDRQPLRALAHVARAAFAGGFRIAGAAPRPRGEMSRGGKARHVMTVKGWIVGGRVPALHHHLLLLLNMPRATPW